MLFLVKKQVRTMIAAGLILFSINAFQCNVQASPWMRSEGESLLASGLGYSVADSFWKQNGDIEQYRDPRKQILYYLHYEYGYSYYHTLFTSAAYIREETGSSEKSGVDNVKLGVRGRLNYFRNGRTWQLSAIMPGDPSITKPGSGKFGADAGIFHRYIPDSYENPFTDPTGNIWGWGAGATIWSGDTGGEVWGYGRWERSLFSPIWQTAAKLSGRSSFAGGERGSVDVFGPNDSYHYDQLSSELSLQYRLSRQTTVGASYKRDLWGRNIDMNEGILINLNTGWKK